MENKNLSNEEMQKVLNKINKLLALSESDNVNEAKLALQRAQELQAKYNIVFDKAMIEEDNQVKEELCESPDTKSLNSLFTTMAAHLEDHFRVKVMIRTRYFGSGRSEKYLVIIGLPFDVEVFKSSFYFAYNSMRSLSNSFVKRLPKELGRSSKLRMKNDYCFGFILGCVEALKENAQSKALMIVTPDVVVKHLRKYNLKVERFHQRSSAGSRDSMDAGYLDGKSAMGRGNGRYLTE